MNELYVYSVPGVSCLHCVQAIEEELAGIPGVASIEVDLETRRVTVGGEGLADGVLRAAIEEAGYDIAG